MGKLFFRGPNLVIIARTEKLTGELRMLQPHLRPCAALLLAAMVLSGCDGSGISGSVGWSGAVGREDRGGVGILLSDGRSSKRAAQLPSYVTFASTEDGGHYLTLSMADAHKLLTPRLGQASTTMADWAQQTDTAAVVNGGYFYSNTPLSLVVADGERLADNISVVTRNNQSYPVLRSAFWMSDSGEAEIGWVGVDQADRLRVFAEPMPYKRNQVAPLIPPAARFGSVIDPLWAIGGGPRLLQNGVAVTTYDEEVFWGSGVELDDVRPRTAICITGDDKLLLYVNEGARLDALPQKLRTLGCVEAMNLDGGGSSAMYVEGQAVFDQQRAVPAVLAILVARG